jgi:hypothetical protein
MLAYAAMAEKMLYWVIVYTLGVSACGFPQPSDVVGDAPVDMQPDTLTCFGDDPLKLCFAPAPTGSINVSIATTFDTVNGTVSGTPLHCATPMSGGNGYCVLAANTITISAALRAVGPRPLVLVAADSIIAPAPGSIDVGSHRRPTESIGAGADPSTGCNAGRPPTTANGTSGGGAGGSFLARGGDGGLGGGATGGVLGGHGTAISTVTAIRGGCPGQDGAGDGSSAHGHGGGAVFLIAGTSIFIDSMINAGGEGGAGGGTLNSGGGGGGAGGMIGFHAATIQVTGTLIANGGAGGEGGSNSVAGNPGGDAVAINAAAGGTNGSTTGGDGGAGSSTAASGSGTNGLDGTIGGEGGGGGGGGGAGLIKGPPASLGTKVSPEATP